MTQSVERQVVLPWGQVLKIAFNSIRVRFFRSVITTMTLALAIAFVAYIWAGYEILSAVWPKADPELQRAITAKGFEQVDGVFGSSPKDRWLAILSVLVAVVGIVNAQLMAVTERFREIGTVKCLGALNSFVVRIFVAEAVFQGFLGGFSGSLAGTLIATFSLAFQLGWAAFASWPVSAMIFLFGSTTFLAVLLSLLGVIYPALIAARMHPAVALRSEQ